MGRPGSISLEVFCTSLTWLKFHAFACSFPHRFNAVCHSSLETTLNNLHHSALFIQKMLQTGKCRAQKFIWAAKYRILENTEWRNLLLNIPQNFFKSLKTDSKLFQMVKIYPSMNWRIVGNVFKLIGHNLENTEFSTEFRINCTKVRFTLSTPHLMFQIAIALFCVNLRNIGATLYQSITQSGKHGIFGGTFRGIFSKVLKLISNCSELSKYSPQGVEGSLETYLS